MQKESDRPPSCFGKQWSNSAKECTGGLDATYTGEHGGHIRPPCDYQEACSSRTQAGKIVPTSNLLRPNTSTPGPGWQQPRTWQPSWNNHNTAPQQPQAHFPTNYGIPQYLSVREPVNQPRGRRFLVELLRSLGKSAGHTIANFFDMESFSGKRGDHDERS